MATIPGDNWRKRFLRRSGKAWKVYWLTEAIVIFGLAIMGVIAAFS